MAENTSNNTPPNRQTAAALEEIITHLSNGNNTLKKALEDKLSPLLQEALGAAITDTLPKTTVTDTLNTDRLQPTPRTSGQKKPATNPTQEPNRTKKEQGVEPPENTYGDRQETTNESPETEKEGEDEENKETPEQDNTEQDSNEEGEETDNKPEEETAGEKNKDQKENTDDSENTDKKPEQKTGEPPQGSVPGGNVPTDQVENKTQPDNQPAEEQKRAIALAKEQQKAKRKKQAKKPKISRSGRKKIKEKEKEIKKKKKKIKKINFDQFTTALFLALLLDLCGIVALILDLILIGFILQYLSLIIFGIPLLIILGWLKLKLNTGDKKTRAETKKIDQVIFSSGFLEAIPAIGSLPSATLCVIAIRFILKELQKPLKKELQKKEAELKKLIQEEQKKKQNRLLRLMKKTGTN